MTIQDFIDNAKYLCKVAEDLNDVSIEKIRSLDSKIIEKGIERLKGEIIKKTRRKKFPSQTLVGYILLNKIKLKEEINIKDYMEDIKKKDFDALKNHINNNEVFNLVEEQLQSYNKNPFKNWTPESIIKHTYYFLKYDNKEIREIVKKMAQHIKNQLKNSSSLEITANSFYTSRMKEYSWFAMYPKNNKGLNHRNFAQIYMRFIKGEIFYGLYKGSNFGKIDNQQDYLRYLNIENLNQSTYKKMIDFLNSEKIIDKFNELNNIRNIKQDDEDKKKI